MLLATSFQIKDRLVAIWNDYNNHLSLFLVGWGVLVRLVQYLNNRSLWGDEVNLALNIIDRSYGELTQVLDHNQAAPLGFLWLEKLATQVAGNNEYALRFVPFIASLIALRIFYGLVRRYSSATAAPIAIALLVGSRYTLYFATELKPYSSDLAICLILWWLLVTARHKILNTKEIVGFACGGSLAIWLSYPAIFVLGSLAAWNFLTASRKLRLQILINRVGVYVCWMVTFALFYYLTITDTLSNEDLSSSWESRYPDSFSDIIWLFDALGRFFYHPMGFSGITDGIGILTFIVGCVAWYRRERTIFWALVSPLIATIVAAYLHQYPFRDRLVLFLTPLAMTIVAEGIASMLAGLNRWSRTVSLNWLSGILGIICLYALVFPAIYRAGSFVIHPELKHEVRPVLEYIVEKMQPKDQIYVYTEANAAFIYYTKLNDYPDLNYTQGTVSFSAKGESSEKYQQLATELQPLRGDRVWFILRADPPAELTILQYLNRIGQQRDSFHQTGATAYLYNLNSKSSSLLSEVSGFSLRLPLILNPITKVYFSAEGLN